MLGNRWLADAKFRRNRVHHNAGRMLAGGQQFQDSTPHGISEDVQRMHSGTIDLDLYKSMPIFKHGRFWKRSERFGCRFAESGFVAMQRWQVPR